MSSAKSAGGQTNATPQEGATVEHGQRRQQKTGRVVSNKMQKTIVVAVESLKRHPLYKRTYKSTTKFKAHDEHNEALIGDMVRIEETRPISKDKRWRLVEITKRAVQAPSVAQVVSQLDPGSTGSEGRR
jgi:small subunit ribosomal protein S17